GTATSRCRCRRIGGGWCASCALLLGIKNAPGWVLRVSCPRALSRGTLTFTSRGLLSVTGWGHGGGRYSQLLRVVSSSSKRGATRGLRGPGEVPEEPTASFVRPRRGLLRRGEVL